MLADNSTLLVAAVMSLCRHETSPQCSNALLLLTVWQEIDNHWADAGLQCQRWNTSVREQNVNCAGIEKKVTCKGVKHFRMSCASLLRSTCFLVSSCSCGSSLNAIPGEALATAVVMADAHILLPRIFSTAAMALSV